ncbi:N-6 DNA methylase [uncultured Thiodictyon sp.]|uniref:type I restriction-modification system subunit M n=1 Tax=uncultured Thiodictyon sp. TaxID=1846217 RepID=UPI0025F71606|nr:N-6 DNA methylase [uncultured Thiodictyon sp.]
MNVQRLENELWEAADQLRANSRLTAAEYSMPVLGLIFLRHADNRFTAYLSDIAADIPPQVPPAQRETLIKLGFQGKAAIYLPVRARFDKIAGAPRGANVGAIIDSANDLVTFHGQEKSDTNTKLARMNLVVHGLDASNIRQGNTFYDQVDQLIGRCDFVMANPPFNVDGVVTDKIEGQVDIKGRLPFGLPGTNAKTGAISNANSLWIQYFYAYLNATGRAGFVMASSASDAGNKDRDIREQLVKTGHVDVMVAIGNKFFYTRSLPCTLWFFDKGKPDHLKDRVLMIDARNVYHVVSARSHIFTEEQLTNLTAIAWLYRGEQVKFIALVGGYQRQVDQWLEQLPACIEADSATIARLGTLLQAFADKVTLAELNADQPPEALLTQATLDAFKAELTAWDRDCRSDLKETGGRGFSRSTSHLSGPDPAKASTSSRQLWNDAQGPADHDQEQITALLAATNAARTAIAAADLGSHTAQVALQIQLDALVPSLKLGMKTLEARHKRWLKLLDTAEKTLRARLSDAFDGKAARECKRALLAADTRKGEAPTVRDDVLDALKQAVYFIHQVQWLHSRFPEAVFADVPGLCKAVTTDEIAASDYSLTPGRYVGTAQGDIEDEDDFAEKLREIHDELSELNDKAVELAGRISSNFEALLA